MNCLFCIAATQGIEDFSSYLVEMTMKFLFFVSCHIGGNVALIGVGTFA